MTQESADIAPTQDFYWSVDIARIERECVLHGWSRRQLARKARVDPKTLRSLLKGRRRPTLGTVRAVCDALGLSFPDTIVFS